MENADLRDLIQNKNLSGIDAYIKNGGSVNVIYEDGTTPLFLAIRVSDSDCKESNASADNDRINVAYEIIERLVEAGANVNRRSRDGNTPLLEALVLKKSKNIILQLLDKDTDVNAVNRMSHTPLLSALMGNYDREIIYKLVQMGANANYSDWSWNIFNTPLFCALWHTDNTEVTKILLRDGKADVEILKKSSAFLSIINCYGRCKKGNCKNKEIIDSLVDAGLDLTMCFTEEDYSSIIHIVSCNYLIGLCITRGVNVNWKNMTYETALLIATCLKQESKVKFLLKFNADPNICDFSSYTPLHCVVMHPRPSCEICELLLYHGGNLLSQNIDKKTPFDIAIEKYCYSENDRTSTVLMLLIKYCLLYMDENILQDFSMTRNIILDRFLQGPFANLCKKDLNKMKCMFIKASLTFHDYCLLKRFYKSKPIYMCSIDELNYTFDQIEEMFPVYRDFIITRIKDNMNKNMIKNNRKRLLHNLEGIIIRPLPVETKNDSLVDLNYDCKYLIGRYFNEEQLVTLFQASIDY